MKIKFRDFTTRAKVIILSGALVLAGGAGYAINKNSNKDQKSEIETTTIEDTEATIDNTVASVHQEYYEEIDNIEEDVVKAINDGLENGMYDYELTEEMKESIVKTYLDYYLVMNKDELSGMTYSILNQDKDMNAMDMINNSMTQEQLIQEQAIISKEDNVLDYSNIIEAEIDRELINDLSITIASMNAAIENNDKEELDRLASHVIEIKDGFKNDNAEYSLIYNPMTIDLAIMLIDSADMLYNGQIITDDEDLAQIFNTSYVRCVDGRYVSTLTDEKINALAEEFEIEGYQNMSREEILEAISALNAKGVSEVSLRSNLRTITKASIEETIENTEILECSDAYSYDSLLEAITERIDLSKHKRPEQSNLDVINNNPYGPNNYVEDGTIPEIGTVTEVEVSEEQVPEDEKVETTEESKNEETGKETTDIYLQAKTNAITTSSSDAASTYASSYAGNATAMPKKSVGTAPSLTCQDYNTVYTYFYNVEWNSCVDSYIAMEAAAIKENQEATTEFVPTTGEEIIIEETTPEDVIFEDDEYFEPIENIISRLTNYKNEILSTYANAYEDSLEEGVKRM